MAGAAKTATPRPAPLTSVEAPATAQIDNRPPIVQTLEGLGIALGKRFSEVHTVNGEALRDAAVVGLAHGGDIILVFREMGVSGIAEHVIPWRHVTRLVR